MNESLQVHIDRTVRVLALPLVADHEMRSRKVMSEFEVFLCPACQGVRAGDGLVVKSYVIRHGRACLVFKCLREGHEVVVEAQADD